VKVLHLVTRFVDGAGGNTLLSVLGADHTRYDVWVAGAPGGPLWERVERAGIRTVKLARLREVVAPLNDLAVLFGLVRLFRRERFTVVHTHSSKAGFLGRLAAWICRTPVVVTPSTGSAITIS
jgi:glycosyl transferase family 4